MTDDDIFEDGLGTGRIEATRIPPGNRVIQRLEYVAPNRATYYEIATALRLIARGLLEGDDGILEEGTGVQIILTPSPQSDGALPTDFHLEFRLIAMSYDDYMNEDSLDDGEENDSKPAAV